MGEGGFLAKWHQRVAGVEVYPAEMAVLMRKNLELVAISGRLRRGSAPRAAFELSPAAALALALDTHLGAGLNPEDLLEVATTDAGHRFRLAPGPIQMSDSRVKPIFYARGQQLTPAWFVEFYAGPSGSVDTDAYRYILSAVDGTVLDKRNLSANEAYTFRVWADPTTGRPHDGPTMDPTPHPTGMPNGYVPAIIAPELVTIDGFNRFNDTWLPSNATETRGNNVDAYSDQGGADGYTNGDLRATRTGPRTFDRTFDVTMDPIANEDQTMASVAEIFYVTNWLHDFWYDSGFDEASGNAQENNLGRGGVAGDPLHAEAQDNVLGGSRNNANMSTPSDGMSPRMQMYSWTGAETARITLTPGGEIQAGTAGGFGAVNFDLTAQIVEGLDGSGTTTDGCEPITNNVFGRIALVDRGTCTFTQKAANVQAAGAVGIIIADNAPRPFPPGLGGADPSITIVVLSVLQSDGTAIRTALGNGPVTGNMFRQVDVDRDGGLDHTVVAHEWGHYLHHRLADCGNTQCAAMSEGWADWNSIYMALADGDDLDGAFPSGVWATYDSPDSSYFGIRRVTYSADLSRNALTLGAISDDATLPTTAPIQDFGNNSEVHNAGEVWCTMMFQAYTALVRTRTSTGATFAEVQRLMGDYVVAGLQITPRDATYTEQRDAILAAAFARSPSDMMAMADAFALRGAGSCALSPPRDSEDFIGVSESFTLNPNLALGTVSFDESVRSCDQDGILDADETGRVRVTVANGGPVALSGASVTLTSTSAGVSFPGGASFPIADLEPFSSTQVELQIALDKTLSGMSSLVLGVRLDAPGSCQTTMTSTVISRVNYDEVGGTTTDDVESRGSPWTTTGELAADAWARSQVAPFDHAWVGTDLGTTSDTSLESPPLMVSATESFVFSFDQRYEFEADDIFWDGGVIEVSTDGGQNWDDLSTYVDPGYGGELTDISGNPLALRMAYVGTSSTWPDRNRVAFDLGTQLAGQTVQIRFRIGTDAGAGRYGWEIDNLDFQGITNAPFETIGEDVGACPIELLADAGPDQTVDPAQIVDLDGTASRSFSNLPLTYAWSQSAGPTVTLTGGDTATPRFAAPTRQVETTLTFLLTIGDGVSTATDSVDITVRPGAAAVVTANAGLDQTVDPTSEVVLDGSGSTTTGADPLTYAWTQTAGTPAVTLTGADGPVARFTAPAPDVNATLTFDLSVSDGVNTAVDTVVITVRGAALSADAGPDQTADAGTLVILDGSQSRSAAGLPLTFAWAQTDGPSATITNADGAVARFEAPAVDADTVLTFELTVGDGTRMATDSVEITVRAAGLTADAGADQTVNAKDKVALDGSRSQGNNLTYAWAQTAGPMVTLSSPASAVTTFTAPMNATTLTFELTVSDGAAMATDTVTITVRAATDEGGCGCSTTHTGTEGSAWAILALAGLGMIFRRRRH